MRISSITALLAALTLSAVTSATAQQQMPTLPVPVPPASVGVDVNIGGVLCGGVFVQAESSNSATLAQDCTTNIGRVHQAGDNNATTIIQQGAANNVGVFQQGFPSQ